MLQEASLFRRHGLELVTTSLVYERVVKEVPQSVSQVYEEADGMAASPKLVAGCYDDLLKHEEHKVPAMQVVCSISILFAVLLLIMPARKVFWELTC